MFEHPIGTINKRLTESTFFPSNWTESGNSTKSRTTSPAGGLLLALRGRCYFSA